MKKEDNIIREKTWNGIESHYWREDNPENVEKIWEYDNTNE